MLGYKNVRIWNNVNSSPPILTLTQYTEEKEAFFFFY